MTASLLEGVGVVLVEYHSGGLVGKRVEEALRRDCAAVVADNSCTYDGPGIVVDTGGNVGFGVACNRAVAALPPGVDVVVLQNPDATIASGDLEALVATVRSGWSAVAPTLVTPSVRRFGFSDPQPIREVFVAGREVIRAWGAAGPGRSRGTRSSRAPVRGHGTGYDAVVQRPGRFGSAALLAVDRGAFESVGGFDEDYFLYVEDLDLWRRLDRAGHRVGFLGTAIAAHAEGAGSAGSVARRTALRWVGRELYAVRHQPRRSRSYRLVHRALMPALRSQDPMVDAVRRGYRLGVDPASILQDVRRVALRSKDPEVVERVRVGWSRTAVRLAHGDRVLDVGSGAFPSPRADVLCERSPDRPHRTAVVDRPFVVADALALPFRDGAFDFVIASHLAEHVEAPDVFCAEIARVADAGYLETPSAGFEKLFPEMNHLWRVRLCGSGVLRFERSRTNGGLARWLGRRLYRWYYAGQDKDRPTLRSSAPLGRLVVRLAYLVRGMANRTGIAVTRVEFGPSAPLRSEIADQERS